MSRATQDTTRFYSNLRIRDFHPLRFRFPARFYFVEQILLWSYNPNIAETILVWAVPVSLAATQGITIVFSSSGYLDVSVPRVCPLTGNIASLYWVAPFGNLRITDYVHLPEAYRSLSRPSSPLNA